MVLFASAMLLVVTLMGEARRSQPSPLRSSEQVLASIERKRAKGKAHAEWLELHFEDNGATFKLMAQDYGSAKQNRLLRQLTPGTTVKFTFRDQLDDYRIKSLEANDTVYTDATLAATKDFENAVWVIVPTFFLVAVCMVPAFADAKPTTNYLNIARTGLIVICVVLTLVIGCDSLYR